MDKHDRVFSITIDAGNYADITVGDIFPITRLDNAVSNTECATTAFNLIHS